VDDASFVGRLERFRNLQGDHHGLIQRHAPGVDPLGKRDPFDELEHQCAALDAVDRCDTRMIEGGEQLRLTLEPGDAFGIVRKRVGQHFDCDLAVQSRIARAIHLALPPSPSRPVISYEPSRAPGVSM